MTRRRTKGATLSLDALYGVKFMDPHFYVAEALRVLYSRLGIAHYAKGKTMTTAAEILASPSTDLRKLTKAELVDLVMEYRREKTIERADALHRKGESALEEAQRLVHGNRNVDYGHPADNDGRIAALMRAYFGWPVRNTDIWIINVLTKLSREKTRPKRDNRVDAAGYAEVGEMIHTAGRADTEPGSDWHAHGGSE